MLSKRVFGLIEELFRGYEMPFSYLIVSFPFQLHHHRPVEPPYPVDEGPRQVVKEVSMVLDCMYKKNRCKRHAKMGYLPRMLPE